MRKKEKGIELIMKKRYIFIVGILLIIFGTISLLSSITETEGQSSLACGGVVFFVAGLVLIIIDWKGKHTSNVPLPTVSESPSANMSNNKPLFDSQTHAQTIYFINGKLCKVTPSDQESWYDARYLVSDGERYDLENVDDIKAIPIPKFNLLDTMMEGYGVTGSLDYVIRMKAGNLFNRGEKELCSACLWKSTELMFANPTVGWQKKDYDRLINWHNEMGMYDEARRAKEYLNSKLPQSRFASMNSMALSIKDSTFQNCKKFGFDLVAFHDYGSGCCEECAKMRGRVYSISGKSQKYPSLPEYVKVHGNFHSGCRCTMVPFSDCEETIYHKGVKIDARKASCRPYVDDRSEKEKLLYQEYVEREENEAQQERDRDEYDAIVEALGDRAPKTFSAYRRMKNAPTANFLKLTEAAKEVGISISPK